MNNADYYEEIGMAAATRAAVKVLENAKNKNEAIPVWEDGEVKYLIPSSQMIRELKRKVSISPPFK